MLNSDLGSELASEIGTRASGCHEDAKLPCSPSASLLAVLILSKGIATKMVGHAPQEECSQLLVACPGDPSAS